MKNKRKLWTVGHKNKSNTNRPDENLRDVFAALAMHALISDNAKTEFVSACAYEYADAMLKERARIEE